MDTHLQWYSIQDRGRLPPIDMWVEFYDGDKTLGKDLLNHIDKVDKHGKCIVNYLHNYTHWRFLTKPNT